MSFEEFQDGCCCGHLGYRNRMILAILNLCITVMPPIKFWLNPTYSFGGGVVWRISRWPPWWPSLILQQYDFSNSESLCHCDVSHQVWLNPTYGLGGDVIWRISRWPPSAVIRKFDQILIENKTCCAWDNIFPIISLCENFYRSRASNSIKRTIRSGPNSNLSEILCLSWIPASLKSCDQNRRRYGLDNVKYVFYHSRASNSRVVQYGWNSNLSEILCFYEIVRDFMLILVIRKFNQISIENKVAVPVTTFPPL